MAGGRCKKLAWAVVAVAVAGLAPMAASDRAAASPGASTTTPVAASTVRAMYVEPSNGRVFVAGDDAVARSA